MKFTFLFLPLSRILSGGVDAAIISYLKKELDNLTTINYIATPYLVFAAEAQAASLHLSHLKKELSNLTTINYIHLTFCSQLRLRLLLSI